MSKRSCMPSINLIDPLVYNDDDYPRADCKLVIGVPGLHKRRLVFPVAQFQVFKIQNMTQMQIGEIRYGTRRVALKWFNKIGDGNIALI